MAGPGMASLGETGTQSVLLIDDSSQIHQLVGARLRSEAVHLLYAHHAAEGMEIARRELPDLILLDLDMPGTDGMTLCGALKEDAALADIPVIFLTGDMDVATKVRAFDLGAVDYVTKPFDAIELKARVRSALRTKRYHDLLVTKAQIDALTGLWNRGRLNDQLMIEMLVLERHGHPVSLIMADIDRFKPINDVHGHLFGDTVIKRIAQAFIDISRDSDIVCRYGGEEYAIILRNTSVSGAVATAERMRHEVASVELMHRHERVPVTASFGVAGKDQPDDAAASSRERLLGAADAALYRAKANGRNRVESEAVPE